MNPQKFEAELRRDDYRVVMNSQVPNKIVGKHCHDFDAKALVLGGEITITLDNKARTFRAGQCFVVPARCMHSEQVGPEGVAFISGRRRNGAPLTREAFESDLRREGFEVVHGGLKPGYMSESHAHDFDARIMGLGGGITLVRNGKAECFGPGDHCEVPAGCMHTERVGPEGVAYLACKRSPRGPGRRQK